jgi:hypothetical protein
MMSDNTEERQLSGLIDELVPFRQAAIGGVLGAEGDGNPPLGAVGDRREEPVDALRVRLDVAASEGLHRRRDRRPFVAVDTVAGRAPLTDLDSQPEGLDLLRRLLEAGMVAELGAGHPSLGKQLVKLPRAVQSIEREARDAGTRIDRRIREAPRARAELHSNSHERGKGVDGRNVGAKKDCDRLEMLHRGKQEDPGVVHRGLNLVTELLSVGSFDMGELLPELGPRAACPVGIDGQVFADEGTGRPEEASDPSAALGLRASIRPSTVMLVRHVRSPFPSRLPVRTRELVGCRPLKASPAPLHHICTTKFHEIPRDPPFRGLVW